MTPSLVSRAVRKLTYPIPLARTPLSLERGAVSFTFDDFPLSAWENAAPILHEAGFRGTYFVAGCFAGRTIDGLRYFERETLRAVAEAGHEIGCHTYDHANAFEEGTTNYVASVDRNMRFLRDSLPDYEERAFAYPFGSASLGARRALIRRFATLRGIQPRQAAGTVDRTLLPSYSLDMRTAHKRDWPAIIERAAAERAWITVFTHDVSDDPTEFGCTTGMLRDVVQLAREHGLDGRTVSEVMPR